MATYDTPTTKYSLPKLDGSSDVSDVDEGIAALADAVDANMAGYAEGTLAARAGVVATAGKLYRTTDTGQVFMGTGSTWIEVGVSPWAPGDLKASWVTTAPDGWLVCDGSAVSRATYAALFAAISTSAGVGNGSTTFNVPDYRGRTFVMPDGAAGRMASNDARGQSGGEERHTLSTGEMPSHVHRQNVTDQAFGSGAVSISVPTEATSFNNNPHFSSSFMEATGGGASHENMPPYLVGGAVLVKT